jgi:hypothetical protein
MGLPGLSRENGEKRVENTRGRVSIRPAKCENAKLQRSLATTATTTA